MLDDRIVVTTNMSVYYDIEEWLNYSKLENVAIIRGLYDRCQNNNNNSFILPNDIIKLIMAYYYVKFVG